MALEQTSIGEYVMSKSSIEAKITALDTIIDKLLALQVARTEEDGVSETWLNDGQTHVRMLYRSALEISKALESYTYMRSHYIKMLNGGGVMVFRPLNSFNR
jgi:hypothetical protein